MELFAKSFIARKRAPTRVGVICAMGGAVMLGGR
jgi:hypothetical protein